MKEKTQPFRNILYSSARNLFRNHSLPRWFVFIMDGTGILVTFIISYLLRFNLDTSAINFEMAFRQAGLVLLVYCSFELIYRSFAGLIRHTTIKDIFNVVITTTSATIALSLMTLISRILGWNEIFTIPESIILIHFVSVTAVMFITRISIKMFYELISVKPVRKKNVIIFGAGEMGVIVKRVVLGDSENDFNIVAILDNKKQIQNKKLSGIPVFSPKKLTKSFLDKYEVHTMIFAIRNIPSTEKSDILRSAVDLGLEVLEVPAINTWLNGQFQLNQLKKIRLEDLLSRDPIKMNMKMVENGLRDKVILVTGAAGSIGSEIVRQLTRFRIEKLILIDNAETPMFRLENELQEYFAHAPVRTILADVTDQVRMNLIFKECQPEIVFHAAAYKHVPLMEENPHEAIRVNVGSTTLLTKLSQKYKVRKFVMVSTDKAVNPTNVMGASKRMCEMVLRSRSLTPGNRTQFVITRFGNVLGSNGSVIPIFKRQIEEGGPVTVTHPEITRYFMTIPEACQLVLEAGFMGMGGEIFVFDMGKPVKILDLAHQMIRLSGFEPDKEIVIEFTGLRPGEKLYEELLTQKEKVLPTYNPKVMVAQVAELDHKVIMESVHTLLYSCLQHSNEDLIQMINKIVPEYNSSNERYTTGTEGNSNRIRKNGRNGKEQVEEVVYPD